MGNYLLGTSTMIERASVRNSIIRREVVIEPDVELADCIIMDYVRICRGARLRNVIVDRHNLIEANSIIGYDLDADRARYEVTPAGVVVIPKGRVDYYARESQRGGPGYIE